MEKESNIALERLRDLSRSGKKLSISDARKFFNQLIKTSKTKDKIGGKTNIVIPGTVMMFSYDPKGKDTLPYYDKHPLVIVVDVQSDGFTGLNLHYLPELQRLALFENLLVSVKGKGNRARMKITYDMLKGAAKHKYFKPCFKKYLSSHLKGKPILIPEEDWEYVVTLPTQKFVGASRQKIYKDSLRIGKK